MLNPIINQKERKVLPGCPVSSYRQGENKNSGPNEWALREYGQGAQR